MTQQLAGQGGQAAPGRLLAAAAVPADEGRGAAAVPGRHPHGALPGGRPGEGAGGQAEGARPPPAEARRGRRPRRREGGATGWLVHAYA